MDSHGAHDLIASITVGGVVIVKRVVDITARRAPGS